MASRMALHPHDVTLRQAPPLAARRRCRAVSVFAVASTPSTVSTNFWSDKNAKVALCLSRRSATQSDSAPQESINAAAGEIQLRQEPVVEEDTGRTCALPTWALIGGITAGVAAALALSAGAAPPAMALGPEGPLVEEFWDNMRRYALYALTVSTGVAYAVLQPIFELLKNPITALLIVAFLAGSGFLVSQVLNAMVGNSEFMYRYE